MDAAVPRALRGVKPSRALRPVPAVLIFRCASETISSTIDPIAREVEVDLGGIWRRGAARVAAQESSGSAVLRIKWVGCEIAREDAIGRKVAAVVAAVKESPTCVAVAEGALAIILSRCGCRGHPCRQSRNQHAPAWPYRGEWIEPHGLIVPQSPFHPSSLPFRNCR
jgi:hypothetical protein